MNATERVVKFICETGGAAIAPEAREFGRRALLDTIGVALAGVDEPAARLARRIVEADGGQAQAAVIGTSMRAPLGAAALANGTAGHALDYDDVTSSVNGHPSIPLVPAVLAVGEAEGASGADVVTAFVVGFEVEGKIGRALGRSHYLRGFHQTTTVGALGAAAAAARLMRLTAEETANALGIAASMSGGMQANFGSMTKPLQAGNAARGGVVAAQLAREGFTGGTDILDGPFGFIGLFAPDSDGDAELIDGFGDPWEVLDPGIAVKKYPCCFVSHRPADAALTLAERHSLTPELVERVVVHVPEGAISPTGNIGPLIHSRPQTGLEGKFSLEYVVAAALFDGELRFANFDDAAVQRPELQAFLSRVTAQGEEAPRTDDDALGGAYNTIEVHTTDGRVLTETLEEPRGGPAAPLDWDELLAKYRDCATRVLDADSTARTAEMIVSMDELADVRALTAALSTAATSVASGTPA